ncbi:hypothetical protein SRHO_G00257970 [Serrasalmus rhombeus]
MIAWQKNGEDLHEDVELRETLPNQDGTFQKRSILTISPEELNRHHYTCIIQHSSLEKEMVLPVSDRRDLSGEVSYGRGIGFFISAILAVVVLLWMAKKPEPSNKSVLTKVIFSAVDYESTATHSLQYLYTAVTPGTSFPEFSVVGLVDGEQFVYYDSNIRKMIPKTEWIKEVEDEDYWNSETQISQRHEEAFRTSVDNLKQRFNQSEGVHTVQWMYGCELDDDGTKRGYDQYGKDGENYISLDLNTLTWTAANAKAVITKEKWDSEPWAPQMKNYLDNDCINLLKNYTGDGRSTVEMRVPPEVSLFQKDSSSPVVCHATGFFPKAVMISWQKNGEDLHEDVELRETLPNQDRTFQKRSVLTVSPEELDKHNYTCIIQHSSLEKEMVLQVSARRVLQGEVSYGSVVVIIISGPVVLILFLWIMKKKSEPSDESLLTKVILSAVDYESTEPSDESLLTKVILSPVDYECTERK